MKNNKSMVAFFDTKKLAEDAVAKLQENNSVTMLSVIATKHEVFKYETQVKAGDFMLLVYGTEADIDNAAKILAISIQQEKAISKEPKRVLSGGETSPFQ